MPGKPVLTLGVTGSIAAYKAVELVRLLQAKDWEISVVMTAAATRYVGPLTFHALTGNPVVQGRYEELTDQAFQHITLAQACDLLLIAPCTANVMAKIAHGMADDVLTSTVLAANAPVMLAPAMNDRMWENPATQSNLALLKERGLTVLDVDEGELACGSLGAGRLLPLEKIVAAVEARRNR